jgi:hypothetical protein
MHDIVTGNVLAPLGDLIDNGTPLNILIIFCIFLKISPLAIFCDEIAMIGSVLNIQELKYIWVAELLYDFNFVMKEINVSDTHIFKFDYFDCVPNSFDVILDALVNFTSVSTADEIFKVKTISANPLFTLQFSHYFLLSITLFDIDRTVSVGQVVMRTIAYL